MRVPSYAFLLGGCFAEHTHGVKGWGMRADGKRVQ